MHNHTANFFSPQYTVIDDAAVEDTEEFSVTFKGVEPHVEPDVESAEFLLIIEDNDSMGHFWLLCEFFCDPQILINGNLAFLFLCSTTVCCWKIARKYNSLA